MAQSVGPDFETADDLIARIRENLQEELSGEAEDEFLDSIMEQLVEMSEIDFPPAAVEMQLDQMMQTMDYRFRQMGIQGLDAFLEMTNQTAEAYREEQREEAEKVLQRNLVLGEIAVAEKVKATDEEIEEQIGVMFGELDEDATEEQIEARKRLVEIMKEGSTRMSVVEQIVTEKTFTLLKALARGEDIPLPAGDDESDASDADSPASEEPVAAENEDASEPTAQAADDSPAEDVVAEVEG